MQNDHSGAIKGLGIANTVITGLLLIAVIGITIFVTTNTAALIEMLYYSYDLDDYVNYGGYLSQETARWIASSHYGYNYDFGFNDYSLYDDSYLSMLTSLIVGTITTIAIVWGIMLAITLAASIIMVVNAGKPEKLKMVMIWSIVGAVIAFLSVSIIVAVMFIIAAVFANSDKKAYQMQQISAPYGYAAPAGTTTMPTPGAGVPGPAGAPVPTPVPVSAPQAPDAPVPGTAPMQPGGYTVSATPTQTASVAPQPTPVVDDGVILAPAAAEPASLGEPAPVVEPASATEVEVSETVIDVVPDEGAEDASDFPASQA